MTVEIIGVPLDLGAGRRGVDMGPSAMRIAGLSDRLKQIGINVIDRGNISVETPETQTIYDQKLKYLPEITRTVTALASEVGQVLQRGNFPLVLGGDHSIAIGTVSGVSSFMHEKNESLGLIWIDAHGDMNSPETTPSGNIHGMPFASILGNGCNELINVAGKFSKVLPQNAVLVGARSVDPDEQVHIRDAGIHVFTMEDIDRFGIYDVMTRAVELVSQKTAHLHVSFDMDALESQVAPGVGTPVRGGLSYREAHTALEIIAGYKKLYSMEIVEVNPILDIRNTTAELAVELVLSAFGKRIL